MIFNEPNIYKKLARIDESILEALQLQQDVKILGLSARDVQVVKVCELPSKPKLSSLEGQARLIHDLASIELQAMELALRSLYEFTAAPKQFRMELADLAKSESEHLGLCLDTLRELGFQWGDWPVHLALWQAVSVSDTLLERIFIVHRYLEASGLDAGESILLRLSGVQDKRIQKTVRHIVSEEVAHVDFGSRWFREICQIESLDSDCEFKRLFALTSAQNPRRERLSENLRRQAGFNESEMLFLNSFLQN